MKFGVFLSVDAKADIDEIYDFILNRDEPTAADWMDAALDQACRSLSRFPNRGNVPKELLDTGYSAFRELHLYPYRIFYQVRERQVLIHCVLDGRRDLQSLLPRRLTR